MPNIQSLVRESLLEYFELIDARAGEEREFLNPLFKGRNSVLDQLHANVRRVVRGELTNRTAIVHGGPGSGKSELMYQLMHQQKGRHGDEIVVVKGSLTALRSTPRLMQLLLQSLPSSESTANAMSRLRGELSRMQAISAFGLSATQQERRTPVPMRSLDDHLVWLHGYLDELLPIVKERIFVFCVDEFQNLADP